MIALLLSLFLTQNATAISADPNFAMSNTDRFKYIVMALRSTVALMPADGSRLCTGTLVSPNKVLTSAHCFDGDVQMQVHLMHDAFTIAKTVQIQQVHIHPLWKIGETGMKNWNARLEPLYRDIRQVIQATPENCYLRKQDWSRAKLGQYLKKIEGQENVRYADTCAAAVPKLVRVLKNHKSLLADQLIDPLGTRVGDLAVAELAEPVNDNFHRPMEIDFDYQPNPGDDRLAFISGFGLSSSEQRFAHEVLPFNQGYARFLGMQSSDLMHVREGAVVCPGDSGGPTAYVRNNKMILVGVNAATDACDYQKATQALSLSIHAHADWLRSIIWN